MARTRVLIVDDSVVIRRLLTDVLSADPAVDVAGTAANGHIALAKMSHLSPHIVVLDVEMPEMNGLETLAALRRDYPHVAVIMFSTLTERGAVYTLDALALGAADYVAKPASAGNLDAATARVRDELIPRIKALHRGIGAPPAVAATSAPSGTLGRGQIADVVTIGVSTGGPNALAALLPQLPGDFPAPVLIVQHMPPLFTRLLAERLHAQCSLAVREAEPGATVEAGTVWIAPGDWHMTVERSGTSVILSTSHASQENSCRPSADVLFRSVAGAYGARTLAVVLTGMGQDGLRGAEAIREAGGRVLVQDEASSVIWGMPGYVANAGLADRVVPLDEMAGEILRRVARAGLQRTMS